VEYLIDFWSVIDDSPILVVGAVLFFGVASGRLIELARLPPITGYIIAGLVLGPHALGLISQPMLETLNVFTTVSLSAIAFSIGSEFDFLKLRQIGGAVLGMTLAQFVLCFAGVTLAMILIGLPLPFALLLGAVATSSAPTTTFALVSSLGAQGRFISYLYGMLALNDAICVVLFGLVSAILLVMIANEGDAASVLDGVLPALGVQLESFVFGGVAGLFMVFALRMIERDPRADDSRVKISFLGLGLITVGATLMLELSHLLVPLMVGLVMANGLAIATMERVQRLIAPYGGPLFLIFLVLAGAQLRLDHISDPMIVFVAVTYVIVRIGAKYAGTALAAFGLGLGRRFRHNLGLCLAAQGGLVIGLLLTLSHSPKILALPPEQRQLLYAVGSAVLLAVFVGQLIGPVIVRFGVLRGTQIKSG
jgi:Kef-type K+ transport system membrane component KefB